MAKAFKDLIIIFFILITYSVSTLTQPQMTLEDSEKNDPACTLTINNIIGFNCAEYEKDLSYMIRYHPEGDCGETFEIEGVELYNVNKEDVTIKLNCKDHFYEFMCFTVDEELPVDGNYRIRMTKSFTKDNYTIFAFDYKQIFIFPNIPIADEITIYHNYNSKNIGVIPVSYKFPPTYNLPLLKINGKYLDRKTEGKIINFEFSEDDLPYDEQEPSKIVEYIGYINNACGHNEVIIEVDVNKIADNKTNITISEAVFNKNCVQYTQNYSFKVKFNKDSEYSGIVEIENVILFNKEQNVSIDVTCKNYYGTFEFSCSTVNDKLQTNGSYSLVMSNDYAKEDYVVRHFNLENAVSFNSEINNPLVDYSPIVISHNYKVAKEGNFSLKFQNKIESFVPSVVIDDKKLDCNNSENILNCKFNKDDFPPKSGKEATNYEGYLNNICGTNEINITLQVSKGSYLFSRWIILIISYMLLFI